MNPTELAELVVRQTQILVERAEGKYVQNTKEVENVLQLRAAVQKLVTACSKAAAALWICGDHKAAAAEEAFKLLFDELEIDW